MKVEQVQKAQLTFIKPQCMFLDTSNAADFKATVLPLLPKYKQVVIDLEQIDFMDSTGLGSLVSCLRVMEEAKGKLSLCNMRPAVRTLFELVRLYKVFEIFDNPDDVRRAYPA